MDKLREHIGYLKQLSNNYFNAILLINSGLAGLFIAHLEFYKLVILFIIGFYFDIICILRYQTLNENIKDLLRSLK